MEFRLLGAVEIHSARGEVFRLQRRQERLALAVLLLEPQRVVTAERLIELLWDQAPPSTARATLQTLMSRIRSALRSATGGEPGEPVRLLALGGGYRLQVQPESVDLHRFGVLIDEARAIKDPNLRAARLAEALTLWQGPALADAATGAMRERLCGSLEEARFAAITDRIDAELAAGRHGELVGELSRLIGEHPLRERLHGQLMIALYRCGRRADALEAYQRARRLLVAELGLEPGPQLREVEASIIADTARPGADIDQQAARTAEPVMPAQLPPGVADFVGRTSHLRQLDALLGSKAHATATVLAVITGTAGVGKTSLAVHWARQVSERFPDGQLFVDMRGFHTGPPMSPVEALALSLGALGVAAERIPISVDAQTALYRSMLVGRRVLVVLDNVADADQVRPLLPGDPGCLMLVTSRDRLSGLVALDGARRLKLDVLPAADAVDVLAHAAGADRVGADRDTAAELANLCGHLPLALRIAGARLADRPHLSMRRHVEELAARGPMSQLRVDGDGTATVRGAFDLSYQALPAEAGRMFRMLSLVPAPAGLASTAVAALTGLPADDAAPLIDALSRFHLAEITADGRLVCHDLLLGYARQLAAEHDAPAERDAAIGRLLHFYLHTTGQAATALNGLSRLRLPAALPPAGVSTVQFPEESQARQWIAIEWPNLIAALDHAAAAGRHRMVWQLAHALRDFMQVQAPLTQWLSVAQTGLAAAQRADDVLGEAAMRHSLGLLRWRTAEFQAAIDECETAAALARRAEWRQGESVALCNTGIALDQLGHTRLAIRRLEQALAIDREIGDGVGEAAMLTNLAAAYEQIGDLPRASRLGELALPLLRQTGQHQCEAIAGINIAMVRREQGRFDDALHALEESLTICRTIGAEHEEAAALTTLGLVHRDAGRHQDATAALTTSLDITQRLSDSRHEIFAHTGLADVQIRQAHLADAADRLDLALDIVDRTGHRRGKVEALLTLSHLHATQNDYEGANKHAAQALDLARTSGYTLATAQAHSRLAIGHLGLEDVSGCLDHCERALSTQRHAGQRLAQARTLLTAGHAYQRQGRTRLANASWRQAHALFEQIGAPERDDAAALAT
ncbi:AfsR/SARP family transcriptional regulator [Nonomuraea sp. LPB2021202275-12-8]|uniref:AfsR/SARP family transcriptional regulator n=1 Tax=Nonomuraea sp. LPB2021202275-12-8 TaxID=3120159 RepID=UPI00300CBC14